MEATGLSRCHTAALSPGCGVGVLAATDWREADPCRRPESLLDAVNRLFRSPVKPAPPSQSALNPKARGDSPSMIPSRREPTVVLSCYMEKLRLHATALHCSALATIRFLLEALRNRIQGLTHGRQAVHPTPRYTLGQRFTFDLNVFVWLVCGVSALHCEHMNTEGHVWCPVSSLSAVFLDSGSFPVQRWQFPPSTVVEF